MLENKPEDSPMKNLFLIFVLVLPLLLVLNHPFKKMLMTLRLHLSTFLLWLKGPPLKSSWISQQRIWWVAFISSLKENWRKSINRNIDNHVTCFCYWSQIEPNMVEEALQDEFELMQCMRSCTNLQEMKFEKWHWGLIIPTL